MTPALRRLLAVPLFGAGVVAFVASAGPVAALEASHWQSLEAFAWASGCWFVGAVLVLGAGLLSGDPP